MHLIGHEGPELILPAGLARFGAAWPGRGLGAKRPSKPLAWRRRAEAKLQVNQERKRLAAAERAADAAERAARSVARRWDVVGTDLGLPDPPQGFVWARLLSGDRLIPVSPEAAAAAGLPQGESRPARPVQPSDPASPAAQG